MADLISLVFESEMDAEATNQYLKLLKTASKKDRKWIIPHLRGRLQYNGALPRPNKK